MNSANSTQAIKQRLEVYEDSLKLVAAMRIALAALEWYALPNPRREEDAGERALEAIEQIREALS